MDQLIRIHAEVARRSAEIAGAVADWPCRKGCDCCCRSLASIPGLTRAEWALLAPVIDSLSLDVGERLRRLTADRPIVCPFLDPEHGHCLVYDVRPIACRTYGFYVERGTGLYCGLIDDRVAGGELLDVIWGNHDAIEARLAKLGESRTLAEWAGSTDTSPDLRPGGYTTSEDGSPGL